MKNVVLNKSRVVEIDLLRVIACLAVILAHVSSIFLLAPQMSYTYTVGNFFDSISRFSVPFFIICSGYFILNENKEIHIKRKVIKLFFLLVFWNLFFALFFRRTDFIPAFIYGHYHMWYLYLFIGLYLMTPVLRLFVKKENKKYIYYLVLLLVVFEYFPPLLNVFVPGKGSATAFFDEFYVSFMGGFVAYYLFGWLFLCDSDKFKKYFKPLLLIAFVAVSVIFFGVQFLVSDKAKPIYDIFYDFVNLPVFVYSVALFSVLYCLFVRLLKNASQKLKSFISKAAVLALGVYLIHPVYLQICRGLFKNMDKGIFYVLVVFLLTTMLSYLTAYILYRIKYVNRLVKL